MAKNIDCALPPGTRRICAVQTSGDGVTYGENHEPRLPNKEASHKAKKTLHMDLAGTDELTLFGIACNQLSQFSVYKTNWPAAAHRHAGHMSDCLKMSGEIECLSV